MLLMCSNDFWRGRNQRGLTCTVDSEGLEKESVAHRLVFSSDPNE